MRMDMTLFNARKLKNIIDLRNVIELEVIEVKPKTPENEIIVDKNKRNVIDVKKVNKTFETRKKFDPDHLLDSKYRVNSAGNNLYECGLSFYKFIPGRNRHKLFNPYWIFTVYLIIMFRACVSLALPNGYDNIHIYLGDYTYVLNAGTYANPANILCIVIIALTQCLHYWDFRRGVRPVYLKPFGVVAGLYPPKAVGLNNEKDIIFMARVLKYCLILIEVNSYSLILLSFSLHFLSLMFTYEWYQTIIFGIPWTVLFSLCVYYISTHFMYNGLYLLFICLYFKSKLKYLNREIVDRIKIKSRKFTEIQNLIRQLDSVYSEIARYNDTYWSRFNFLFNSMISAVLNLFLYQSLFLEMVWFLRVIFFYFCGLMAILAVFYLKTNAYIFHEAVKAYETFNKLYLEYNQWSMSISLRLKVIFLIYLS